MWVTDFSEHGCRMSIYRVSESIPGLLRFVAKSEAYRQYCRTRYSVTFASFPVPGSVAESDQHGSAFLLLLDLDPHSECRSRSLKREKIHKNHLKVSTLVAGLYQYFYPMFCIRIRIKKCLLARIRIHMDIFGILDPDQHENLCGSETLW